MEVVDDLVYMKDEHVEALKIPALAKCKTLAMHEWFRSKNLPAPAPMAAGLTPAALQPLAAAPSTPTVAQPAFVFRGFTVAAAPGQLPPSPPPPSSVPPMVPSAPVSPPTLAEDAGEEEDEEEVVPLAVMVPVALALAFEEEEEDDEEEEWEEAAPLSTPWTRAHPMLPAWMVPQDRLRAALPPPVPAAGAPVPAGGLSVAGAPVVEGEHISLKVKGQVCPAPRLSFLPRRLQGCLAHKRHPPPRTLQ